MSFYNTGNPVPSIDPRDLDDNAKHIDEIANSTELTYVDRLGVERLTMAGVNAQASGAVTLRDDLAEDDGAQLSGYRNSTVYDKLSDFVSVSDFPGTDVAAIVAAAAHCNTNKKQLLIDRDLTITSLATPIDILCSVKQQPGTTINISNAGIVSGLFRFKTAQTGTVIIGVGGLTDGSTKLTGLPAAPAGSWLLIESTEELIKDTSAGFYVKQEIATIADILGGLKSPLTTTYTVTPTVTLFAPETPLAVEGLTIKGNDVEISNTSHNLIEVYRRSARVSGLNISGVPNQGSQIKFNQTPVCTLKDPSIVGHTAGNGYGVLSFMTENLAIENPDVSNCRHAYAARHDKNTSIIGGAMSEIIDSHYGYNLIVRDCSVIGQVQYAGRDLSITGCEHTPKDYCIRIRNTSPELKGKVIYEGNTVNVDSTVMAGTHFAFITSGLSSGTFTFGRNLAQPNLVSIKNNPMNIISMPTNITYARMLTSQGFTYSLPTRYEIEGNVREDYTKTIDILTGFVKADNVDFTANPSVYVRYEKNCRISVTSQNTAADVGKGFALDLHDLSSFILFMNPNTLVDSKLTDVNCSGWALPSGGAQSNVDNGRLIQRGMSFSGAVPVEISRLMSGEIFFRSLPDDTASYFRPGKEFGHLSVVSQSSLQWSGIAGYDVQATGAFNNTIFNGTSFATTTGVLAGTTGTDGNLTISPAIDGKIYVENRAGAGLTLQIKEMNFGQ